MDDTAKKARREYYRAWRKNNPERVKQTQERYWLRKAAQIEQRNNAAAEPVQGVADNG